MRKIIFTLIGILALFNACTYLSGSNNSQVYENYEYNFAIEVPEGPYIFPEETTGLKDIIIGNSGNGSPFAEMNIRIEDGSLSDIEKHPNETILKEEDIEINNVEGKLIHYAYFTPGETEHEEDDGCPVYILDDKQGHIFTFREWECMYSPIFEDVVNSFELVKG